MGILDKKITVLIIDDSIVAREALTRGLSEDKGLEVIGAAADVFVARDLIVKYKPDVITLDIEMPRMDGIEFLRRLMPQYPVPIVVVSGLTQRGKEVTLRALEAGAVDYVAKPGGNLEQGFQDMMVELRTKIKIASTANVHHWKSKRFEGAAPTPLKGSALANSADKIIAIGASTGGTEAIRLVIEHLPPTTPGIVIVQHMPKGFTRTFADRMNEVCLMQVKEAEHGDRVLNGRILVAPGDMHMRLVKQGGLYSVELSQEEKVNGHRPSVDVLFRSVASAAKDKALGVLLTGMGSDGAAGLLEMRNAGARTIGQNQASCIVYGMPKVAFDIGAVEKQLALQEIPSALLKLINQER